MRRIIFKDTEERPLAKIKKGALAGLILGLIAGIIEGEIVFLSMKGFGASIWMIFLAPVVYGLLSAVLGAVFGLIYHYSSEMLKANTTLSECSNILSMEVAFVIAVILLINANEMISFPRLHPVSLAVDLIILAAAYFIWKLMAVAVNSIAKLRRDLILLFVIIAVLILGFIDFRNYHNVEKPAGPPTEANNKLRLDSVIIVVIDTLRADHLSCMGYEKQVSPVIDKLASEGILFENAYASSSWTVPSHFSLMTGVTAGAVRQEFSISPTSLTLPKRMNMLGYRTVCVSANPLLSEAINFNQGFQVFDNRINILNHLNFLKVFDYLSRVKIKRPIRGSKIKLFNNAELVTDYALDFIDRYSNEPYFMFINYMDVHDPYIPPAKYREIYSKPYNGKYTGDICGDLSEAQFIKQHVNKMTKDDWDHVLSQYDGAIKYIDDQIERITKRLEEKGKMDNTLLVVLSDHGELFGEYGLATHHLTLSEEETHIPVIIHYPSVIKKPARVKSLARIIDIYPTLQELLGFRMTDNFFIEGVPLLNRTGEPTNKAGYAAMVLYENDYKASILGPAFRRNLFGYRVNDWKYLYPIKNRKFDWSNVNGEIFRSEQIEERLYKVDHQAGEKLVPDANKDMIVLLRSFLLEWREMIKKRNKNLGSAIESMEYRMKTILTGYNQPY